MIHARISRAEISRMTKKLLLLVAMACSTPVWSADTATSSAPAAPTEEQILEQLKNDLQSSSADIMAKGMTLTAEQAAKFWPLFETYQKEQSQIVEDQIKATQAYARNYKDLSDQEALAYVSALLERDQKVHALRMKWLAKFQTIVPPRIAARAIQLERRMGIVTQVKLSSQIPLIR
jgi:Spy/CpxP family protein refolding chaperone